jgi:hypothetical protein
MNNLKKILSSIAIFAMMFLAIPTMVPTAQAQSIDPCKVTGAKPIEGCNNKFLDSLGLTGLTGISGVQGAIVSLASLLVILIAAVSVIYLLLNAYKMVSDNGDGKGWGAGLAGVKYSIGGLVLALLAFGIVRFIVGFIK